MIACRARLRRRPRRGRRSRPGAGFDGASAAHHEIDRFRSLALLVGLDIEADALPFVEALQSGRLDRRDVDEHVAPAVVRFDEAVTTLAIEELDHALLRHRETPTRTAAGPTHGGAARNSGKASAPFGLRLRPCPPTGGGTPQPREELHTKCGPLERKKAVLSCGLALAREPVQG